MLFSDVMDIFPFEKCRAILKNPQPLDDQTFAYLCTWTKPKRITHLSVLDAMVEAGVTKSKKEGRRLIDQGGVSWNGTKINSVKMELDFSGLRWGVFKKGKRYIVIRNR